MSTLDDLYAAIILSQSGTYSSLPDIYPHYVYYSRFLIEDKLNIKLSLQETWQYLFSEGLLPDNEYVSKAYLTKWHL